MSQLEAIQSESNPSKPASSQRQMPSGMAVPEQKINEEAKCDQLMELFYRVYDELQKLQNQKNEFERRVSALHDEQNDLIRQQKEIQQ